MSLTKKLIDKHGACLNPSIKAAAEEFARRAQAAQEFGYPSDMSQLQAQTGYVLFEREFSPTPMVLFGQDVKSLAHTHMHIFRADVGPEGEFVQGKKVFSARISEKSLTEAMLLSNSSDGAPLTITQLGDFVLPVHQSENTKVDRSAEAYRDEQMQNMDDALSALRAEMDLKPQRTNANLKGTVATIGYKIRDMLSTKFAFERHLENMSIMRSEVLTEAAHAALHAKRIGDALRNKQATLPPPAPIDWDEVASKHPMVDTQLDHLSDDLKEALRILIVEEIRALAETYEGFRSWVKQIDGKERGVFPESRERTAAAGYGSESQALRKYIDELAMLSNWAFNPHIDEDRPKRRPTQASLSVTQRSGWRGDIHSALPPSDGAYFAMTVRPAWDDLELGRGRVQSASERLVEIEMVAEDLMTALRGHPEGHSVPCSIRALCGAWRRAEARPMHKVSADIEEFTAGVESTAEVQHLRQSFACLEELVNAKRSGQKWRDELQSALLDVEAAIAAARQSVDHGLTSGRQKINAHVVQSAEEILSSIARALPPEAMDLLRLDKPE
jgi:hypothetical protein